MSLIQYSDIVSYFLVIVIFYFANTTAFHIPGWKFSEGVVRWKWVTKWVAPWKRSKTTGL